MNSLTQETSVKLTTLMGTRNMKIVILRGSVDKLLQWILDNIYPMTLPCGCQIFPSGEFVRTAPVEPSLGEFKVIFSTKIGNKHNALVLEAFSQLISDGFLEQLCTALEEQNNLFSATTETIDSAFRE